MKTRTMSSSVAAAAGSHVRVAGWVHRVRELSAVTFLLVRDADGVTQVVLREPTLRGMAASLVEESVVEVRGEAVLNEQAPGGAEVVATGLEVLSPSEQPPVELWRPTQQESLPHLLDNAAVSLRHPRRSAVVRLAAASMAGFRAALDGLGFMEITTPKLVASATESGANVFGVDYFGSAAYLAQSPQFYKQTMVGVLERVYEVAPVFRAEPHDTSRHLATYVSLDAELGFIRDHRDVMMVLRDVIDEMLGEMIRREPAAVADVVAELPVVPAQIPVVHFAEAQELLARHTDEDPRGEPDLSPAHERWLGEWCRRQHGSDFLFVEGYPMAKRPFYTAPEFGRPEYSASFDVLFRGQELVTGGQRLHRYADYEAALEACGESPEGYATYLDAFRYGMPPHGGFAIGLERWMARLTGAANIREVSLFPRDLHRLTP